MTLVHFLHRSSGSRSSPDICFPPSSLTLSCSRKVLQDLGSDHQPILLSIPLSPVFRPNERPPSFNFKKVCWDDLASYFDYHCPSAEEYSSLSFSSAAALFTTLALNAANLPNLSAASNAILKAGGLLKWKKQLLKNARHGGRPWSPRSRVTPQDLDQRSYRDKESPKSERRRESVAGQCRMR